MSNILSGWLTPVEAAKKVGKSTQTIYHHIRNEHFIMERVGGRLFVNEESLLSYYRVEQAVGAAQKNTAE